MGKEGWGWLGRESEWGRKMNRGEGKGVKMEKPWGRKNKKDWKKKWLRRSGGKGRDVEKKHGLGRKRKRVRRKKG